METKQAVKTLRTIYLLRRYDIEFTQYQPQIKIAKNSVTPPIKKITPKHVNRWEKTSQCFISLSYKESIPYKKGMHSS